jgi:hypothetical protein
VTGQFELRPQSDGTLQIEFLKQGFSSPDNQCGGGVVQARQGAPTLHSGQPSLLDKKGFFPAVLGNRDFREKGVLFGTEASIGRDCKWVVIDPNRHKLSVWEKPFPTSNFACSGQALGASVFTNGPMVHARTDGNKAWLGAKYIAKGCLNWMAMNHPAAVGSWGLPQMSPWQKAADDVFAGPPYGSVFSFSNQINIPVPNV